MVNNDRWIYGEFVRKRWGVNERTLATIVYDNGIQAYDVNNERLDVDEASGSFSDGLKFKLDDIEEFELQNEHLFNPEQPAFRKDSKAKKGQWMALYPERLTLATENPDAMSRDCLMSQEDRVIIMTYIIGASPTSTIRI